MNLTVINGSARRGSTYNCKELFLEALKTYGKTAVKEFTLPKDMPSFCRGCFSCFLNGEKSCPDAAFITPIIESLQSADVVIITSPVYALQVSGQLKALLDHLCFMWASHRPDPKMFGTIGVVFTTTAGMGLKSAVKTIKNSMDFWGFKRVFVFKKAVSAMKWDDVPGKTKAAIEAKVKKLAKKTAQAVGQGKNMPHRLKFKLLFRLMRGMQRKNTWNPTDREHWEKQGWLDKKTPF